MRDLKQMITAARQQYLAEVKARAKSHSGIAIYGAGIYGRALHGLLKGNGIEVSFFCVTKKEYNISVVDGIPVREINNLQQKADNYLFLIAAAPPVNRAMALTLQQMGLAEHYMDIPIYMEELLDNVFFRPVLEITTRIGCSVHCRYCPQNVLLQKYYAQERTRDMSLTVFKTCLHKMPQNVVLDFSGFSEPFLNRDTTQMLLYAAEAGMDIRLYTTFVGMTLNMFQQIEDIPFLRVVVHLPDVNHYAHIPMTDEYFQILHLAVNKRKKDGSPFIDIANCQSEPHPDVVAVLKDRVAISWSLINRAGNLDDGSLTSLYNGKDMLYCSRAADMNHIVLLPNGDAVLCCMDYGMKHLLGNLLQQSYEELMQGEEMRKIRSALKSGGDLLCRHCTAAKILSSNVLD